MANTPLRVAIVPVTPLNQNCSLIWSTETMRGAFVDPGGDLPKLHAAREQHGVTIEKILLTHGHIDHCGGAGTLARELSVPIEGPHEADRFWIARLDDDGGQFGMRGEIFEPDRWLDEGDTVSVGGLDFAVHHTPGHTPGHVVFHQRDAKLAIVGDVLFADSVGRTDFPMGSQDALIDSIVTKLWPMGDDTAFLPGHGPMSSFGRERKANAFVSDDALSRRRG